MSQKLQHIINLLCDGRCRSINELREETNLSKRQIDATVAFLLTYGFAEMHKEIGVRITRDAEKLFTQKF